MSGATAEQFKEWRERYQSKSYTWNMLTHAFQDCRKASRAMQGWNPEKENLYADEAWTIADEMNVRRKKNRIR